MRLARPLLARAATIAFAVTAGCAPAPPDAALSEEHLEGERLHIDGGMTDFNASLSAGDPKPRCLELAELAGAYLCGWYERSTMNDVLVRASVFAWGRDSIPKGTLIGRKTEAFEDASFAIAAHDIQGESLGEFWKSLERACAEKGGDICPSESERTFFEDTLLPILESGRPMVLLAYDGETAIGGDFGSVAHEFCHARYFLERPYRSAVDAFWKSLAREDRATIRSKLEDSGYDPKDELLMINEFQAYTFTRGWRVEGGTFGPWRTRLVAALENEGIRPVAVR